MAKTGLSGITSRPATASVGSRAWLRHKFWSGGLLSLLALVSAVAGITLLAADLKITPLPYRLRRHLAPILMPSYDTQLDAELQPGEVVHIGLVVPITARGQPFTTLPIDEVDANKHLIVFKVHFRSVVDTIRVKGDLQYHMYFGIDKNEKALADRVPLIEKAAKELTEGLPIDLKIVYHDGLKCLSQMYNTVAAAALADNNDYFMILNDDLLMTDGWSQSALLALRQNPLMRDFGMAGPYEYFDGLNRRGCTQYPMVSRIHFEIMGSLCDEERFCAYGLDESLCDMYIPFDSCFYISDMDLLNHVGLDGKAALGRRYAIKPEWHEALYAARPYWKAKVQAYLHEQKRRKSEAKAGQA